MVNEVCLPRSVVRGVLLARGSRRVLRSEQRSRRAREAGTLRPARYGPPAGLASGTDISVQASRHGWPVLAEKLRSADRGRVELEVAASEFHVYPLLPTQAGAQARQRIARAVDWVSATYPYRM